MPAIFDISTFLFAKPHPVVALLIAASFLPVVIVQSGMSSLVSMYSGTIGASTYPAKDADMLGAKAAYCASEAGL